LLAATNSVNTALGGMPKANKATINYFRKIANETLNPGLQKTIYKRTDADIQKDIERLKSK